MAEKSVIEKLGLTKHENKAILNKPEEITDFEALTYDSSLQKDNYDLIFFFAFSLEDLMNQIDLIKQKNLLNVKGYIYVAYPKKGNKKYDVHIHRDDIYNGKYYDDEGYLHNSELKFAKMASLNEDFTVIGIKHEPRKAKKSTKASQCVADYICRVDDVRAYLAKDAHLISLFEALTPGYQRDWARYIYSAKREETQEKRKQEMERVLGEGYKTMDLYRMNKK